MKFKIPMFFHRIRRFLDRVHLPILGVSVWKIFEDYANEILRNKLLQRSSAISWSFFLSLFPFILFLLSVLPYLPHYDELQSYIFDVVLLKIFPSHIHADVTKYINQNIIPNLNSLSNFTIVFALIFATNGTFSLINGFNENTSEKKNDVYEFILSFFITIGFITIIFLSLFGVYYSEVVLKMFSPREEISWLVKNLTQLISFVSFPIFYFVLLALFYWLGTIKLTKFRHAIPGALFTTIIFFLTTYLFAFYVTKIATYNVLYGSIGSIILLMVWVNVNVVLMRFGNELNISIRRLMVEKRLTLEMEKEIESFTTEPHDITEILSDHQVIISKDQDKKTPPDNFQAE